MDIKLQILSSKVKALMVLLLVALSAHAQPGMQMPTLEAKPKEVCNGENIELELKNMIDVWGTTTQVTYKVSYDGVNYIDMGIKPTLRSFKFTMPYGVEEAHFKAVYSMFSFGPNPSTEIEITAKDVIKRKKECSKAEEKWKLEANEVCNGENIQFTLTGNTPELTPLWKDGTFVVPSVKYSYSLDGPDKDFKEIDTDIANYTMPEGVEVVYIKAEDETGKFYKSNVLTVQRKADCPLSEKWEISTDQIEVCEGEPIIFNLKGLNATQVYNSGWKKALARYQYSTDGVNFEDMDANITGTAEETFVFDMPAGVEKLYVKAEDKDKKYYTSNTIEIKKSQDCPTGCHLTSTGDIFQGTDFDPINPNDPNPRIPDGVENYFGENNIGFENNQFDDYTIMQGLSPEFDGLKPKKDGENGKNFYYNINGLAGSKQPFTLRFPRELYAGKTYTFDMRMYVHAKPGCDQWRSAKIIARTGHGTVSSDTLVVSLYNDRTDELLGSVAKGGLDVAVVEFNEMLSNEVLTGYPDLIRVEMSFYGSFPVGKTENYSFYPMIENMTCGYAAIDYISAQSASICLTKGSECVGNSTTVNAAGFPRSTIYHWEEQDADGSWHPLVIGGVPMIGTQYAQITIPVKNVGVTHYRMWSENAQRNGNGEPEYFFFKVVGRNCNPDCPKFIVGDAKICTPGNAPVVYGTDPEINADKYPHKWTLTDPYGNVITDPNVLFPTVQGETHSYSVMIPEHYPEGKYKMSLRLYKKEGNEEVEFCGNGIDTILEVFHRPKAKILVNGDKTTSICPYNSNVEFSSQFTDNTWGYEWTNAKPLADDETKAKVEFPMGICDSSKFKAMLTTYLTNFEDCKASDDASFDVDQTTPVIACDKIEKVQNVILKPTDKDTLFKLPKPEVNATCDGNPNIIISAVGTLPDGSEFNESFSVKLKDFDKPDGVTIKLKPTATATGDNGILITYTATDSCAKTESEKCEFTIIVRDVDGPAIDCEDVKPRKYDVMLSNYEGCVAVPGQHPSLPVITPQTLIDSLNGEAYTAIYNGRTHNGNYQDAETIAIDAEYGIGQTIIHWIFKDFAGNSKNCDQEVYVNDDKKPEVSCPALNEFKVFPDETGDNCTVSAAGLIDQIKTQLDTTGHNIPTGTDRCENNAVIDNPRFFYRVEGTTEWKEFKLEDQNIAFEMKTVYELEWRFYKVPGVGVVDTVYSECRQKFSVIDNKKPKFDCKDIPDVLYVVAPTGLCVATHQEFMDAVYKKLQPWPEAILECTGDKIPAEVVRADGKAWGDPINVGDVIDVYWIFKNEALTTGIDTCEKQIKLISDIKPAFDCANIPDTVRVTAPTGTCEAPFQAFMDSLKKLLAPWPNATEVCTGDSIPGYIVMEDGSKIPDVIPVGTVLNVKWVFEDTTKTTGVNDDCKKAIKVISDKRIDGDCGNVAYGPISIVASNGECSMPADTVKLVDHEATHPCILDYVIKAVPSRSDKLAMDQPYPVGKTTYIYWTFTDTTHSLKIDTSICTQKVNISDGTRPIVDCQKVFPDTTIYLDADNCVADYAQVKLNLGLVPVHPCTNLPAEVSGSRSDGKDLKDIFEVAADPYIITWTLSFSDINKYTCYQKIGVKDTLAPYFDCSLLKDITIEHRDAASPTVPFSRVEAEGFSIPEVTDKCSDVTTAVARSDGKAYNEDYPIGYTTVYFAFSDKYGNTQRCSLVVHVTDMIPPVIKCPTDYDGNLNCLSQIPEPIKTYEEFFAHGGGVDPISKVVLSSFRHEDVTSGTECNSVTRRTYMFTLINGESVGCQNPQIYTVIDNIAPEIHIDATSAERITTCSVQDTIGPVVTVTDNCDPNPTLYVERICTQGDDPSKCDYYQYDVIFNYTAKDRCDIYAVPQTYTIHVVSQEPPIVTTPADWDDRSYPKNLGNCMFGTPDITDMIPKDNVQMICGETDYLKVYQNPPAGTVIDKTTNVELIFEDVCGNKTVLTKEVYLQTLEERLSVIVHPHVDVCADENVARPRLAPNNLTHSNIRMSTGFSIVQEFDGEYVQKETDVFWDCYRDSISPVSIVFSDNPNTYGPIFADASNNDAAFAKYNLLTRRNQSGTYIYVATDTLSGCTATGITDINVIEVPRLSIADNKFDLCNGDSIPVNTRFAEENPICADPMGAPITAHGWMLNDKPYVAHTPVTDAEGDVQKAYYYATNICGTTTTLNSLYTSCTGAPSTLQDSLAEAGSVENYLLWLQDKMHTHDSVRINVFHHSDPSEVLLTTKPIFPSRVWAGEQAELILTTPYTPAFTIWMMAQGDYDGMADAVYNQFGQVVSGGSGNYDDVVLGVAYADQFKVDAENQQTLEKNRFVIPSVADTGSYYVLVGNGVCPTVSSNLVKIDVAQIPTAFTPYDRDGFNDVFMEGHHVKIFNRYGGFIFEGDNGWNGTSKGVMVDPGVYYYETEVAGNACKGSIETVKNK